MNILAKTLAVVSLMAAASVALAQSSGSDVSERLAKLSERLKKLDTNGNGKIDADEAASGVGRVIMDRLYPGGQPSYPIDITEILKVAEAQYRGLPTPAAATPAPAGGATSPSGPSASPSTPGRSSPAPSVGTLSNGSSTGQPGRPGAPPPSGTLPGGSALANSGTSAPPVTADVKPPTKSGRFRTAKERLPSGLPDWFIQKADADGQITMAEFTDNWTPDKLAEFEKYDLNHDGIITAAEVLKVEKQRGGK